MRIVRWEPVPELSSLQQEMNRVFNRFFDTGQGNGQQTAQRWVPSMDLIETDNEYVLRADLPGLGDDDIKVEFENNVLTISGERKSEKDEHKEGYHRIERATGSFVRSLTLPEGIDPNSIKARFDKGVLEVRVQKPPESKPRRVSIDVGSSKPTIEGKEG